MMNKITRIFIFIIISGSILLAFQSLKSENIVQTFTWEGKWLYESDNGKLLFIVHLKKTGYNEFIGWHTMVDGRIHGGAIDSYSKNQNGDIIPTLTNSVEVSTNVLEFSFHSGYSMTDGKVQIEAIDSDTIIFRMPEVPSEYDPSRFHLSPLANLLYQMNGLGPDATGGIKLTRQ